MLRAWGDAPAFLVSCPGPLRRHAASVQPVSQLELPQCLLGAEAQLRAFLAVHREVAERAFFLPLPEMFDSAPSLANLERTIGHHPGKLVHLRFGGTRSARVLKVARNGLVLVENHTEPPITASQHPFASGRTLPPGIRRVFAYSNALARPAALGGGLVPLTVLDGDGFAGDLPDGRTRADRGALELVSLAEFRSLPWASGPIGFHAQHLEAARAGGAAPLVLLPWNLEHPGSAIPALVERTLRLQSPSRPAVRLVLMPFNYPGQTGLIRRLIRQVRNLDGGAAWLPQIFIARLTDLAGLPALRRLAPTAWIDGNDPEHAWTRARLRACGITPILLAVSPADVGDGFAIIADEGMTIDAETRFGLLHFRVRLPSLREVRHLLPIARELSREQMRARRRRGGAA